MLYRRFPLFSGVSETFRQVRATTVQHKTTVRPPFSASIRWCQGRGLWAAARCRALCWAGALRRTMAHVGPPAPAHGRANVRRRGGRRPYRERRPAPGVPCAILRAAGGACNTRGKPLDQLAQSSNLAVGWHATWGMSASKIRFEELFSKNMED